MGVHLNPMSSLKCKCITRTIFTTYLINGIDGTEQNITLVNIIFFKISPKPLALHFLSSFDVHPALIAYLHFQVKRKFSVMKNHLKNWIDI